MYDIIIIGSGPAGLSAAIYAARTGLSFAVVEKEYQGTGQIALTERVDNYPGAYGTDGFSLGESFREHAEALGTEFIEAEAAEIVPGNGFYRIALSGGSSLEARAVIIAAGAYPRRLGIPGEEELSGRGVSYCAVCDGAFFSGGTVAVIGGGDTALGDALYLSRIAEKVYLVHRRDKLRGSKILQDKVKNTPNIELVLEAKPISIEGDTKVAGLNVSVGGKVTRIDTDAVFVAVGAVPQSGLLKGLAELDENGYAIAGEDGVTSAAGIFAAGDVRTKPLRQVVTAAADGANCVYSAEAYLASVSDREG